MNDNNKNNNKNIDFDEILIETINENKIVYLSSSVLSISLLMSIIIFPSLYNDFVSRFPDKLSDINYTDIIIVGLPYIISETAFYFSERIDSYTIPKIENEVIHKLISKSFDSIKTTKKELNINELIFNLKKIFDVRDLYHLICSYVLPALAISFGISYYYIKADFNCGILVSIILFLTFISLLYTGNTCSSYASKNESDINIFYDDVYDVLNNVDHVIVSGMENKEKLRIKQKQSCVVNSNIKKDICDANFKFTFSMIYFFILVIFNGIAVNLYKNNKISKSILITIFLMVASLVALYDAMIYELSTMTKSFGYYNEIKRYFSDFQLNNDAHLISEFPITSGEIEFKNINLTISGNTIFNNFNLKISPNKITGIMGEIGSGKTTLLKILLGLVSYDGIINIDTFNISKYTSIAISKHIAYIPQHPKLFNRTIYENLNYGSSYTEEQIWKLIDLYELRTFFNSFKYKLQTHVGKNGEKLSGGQRQLIYIFRTFIQNKKILLFDEPSSALDNEYRNILIKLLSKIQNKTILIVTHDKELSVVFDRLLIFNKGTIFTDIDL